MRSPGNSLSQLALGYERTRVVENVILTMPYGSMASVLGPNGAGKSTLLKGLAGLLKPLHGRLDGLSGHRVAYMPQQTRYITQMRHNTKALVKAVGGTPAH